MLEVHCKNTAFLTIAFIEKIALYKTSTASNVRTVL